WHGCRTRLLSLAIWFREVSLLTVLVILPIRNEVGFIARALASVLMQDYFADRLEVLVVDGDSTDGTRAIVQAFIALVPGRLRLLDNPDRIVSTGLNAA